jgi:hypothetical protein
VAIQIQSVKKCAYLRQIAEGAKRGVSTLKDALLAAQGQVYQPSFQLGRIVVSTSGSGQSGSFQMVGGGNDWTQDNIFGLLEEFIQLLDLTVSQGTPDGDDPATVTALFEQMVVNIQTGNVPQTSIRTQMGDFSGLNWPAVSYR